MTIPTIQGNVNKTAIAKVFQNNTLENPQKTVKKKIKKNQIDKDKL